MDNINYSNVSSPRPLLVSLLVTAMTLAWGEAAAAESRTVTLMEQHKCYICHGEGEAKAGPAFVEIAAHYRGRPNAVARLAARMTRGAHGELWNMPPHPELSREEARLIARYIVSRK